MDSFFFLLCDPTVFFQKEEVAVKSLRNDRSDRNCSDFIKEIKNMVKLQSMTSGSHYVIKLRGVSQSKSTLSQWQRAANHVFC